MKSSYGETGNFYFKFHLIATFICPLVEVGVNHISIKGGFCDECADAVTPSSLLSPLVPSACRPDLPPGLCGSVGLAGGSTCSPPAWPGLRPASPVAEPARPLWDRVRLSAVALGEYCHPVRFVSAGPSRRFCCSSS